MALTGGIATGKSHVRRAFEALGVPTIDADVLAREVVAPGTVGLAAVVAEFGTGVLAPDGELDRPALARLVFADRPARERLNAIVHPLVRERSARLLEQVPPDAVVIDTTGKSVEEVVGEVMVVVHRKAL